MEKIEYKIEKDNDFIGKRYESYTVEKHIIYDNGETEIRTRVVFPHIDGELTEENLNKLVFQKSITEEEWQQLSQEYRSAWINGTMTDELCKELETLRQKEGVA